MGWIILCIIIALILIPFCIPVIVRVQWRGSGIPLWSVHYGRALIAPGGAEKAKQTLSVWKDRTGWIIKLLRPVLFVLKWIFRGLLVIGTIITGAVVILYRFVSYPVRVLLKFVRRRKPASTTESADRFSAGDEYHPPPSEPDTGDAETSGPLTPGDEMPGGDSFRRDEAETSEFPGGEGPAGPESKEGYHDPGEASGDKYKTDSELKAPFTEQEPEGPDGIIPRFRRIQGKVSGYLGLIREYGPLGRRTLKLVIRLGRGYWRALRWKRLEFRVTSGGDPATLGEVLGWYHALDKTLGKRRAPAILFYPDFNDHTFSPRGELDLDLRVIPILFFPPTFGFAVQFPYLKWWRVVKLIKKEQI